MGRGSSQPQDQLHVTSSTAIKEATGTENAGLQSRLIEQVRDTLWLHSSLDPARRSDLLHAALAMLQGIKPTDEIEGMLAAQMVATHSAAMECLRRSMIEGQTFEGRDNNLKHASKLLGLYARQIEVLNKHRGKGQQKVTVEHVHVEAGGQAVVGHVNATQAAPEQPTQKNLTHAPGEALDLKPKPQSRARAKRHGS